jgi:clan AA aspartic protease (TIGR02281 family)
MQQVTAGKFRRLPSVLLLALMMVAEPAVAETIQLQKQGETYRVSGRLNGAVTVNFVFDTGASDVALPEDAVEALKRAGKLDRSDYVGKRTYRIADGSTVSKDVIILRELTVGGHTVTNVTASVGRGRSPALLGQSFLSKFPSWTLDNERNVLVIASKSDTAGATGAGERARGSSGSKYGAVAHDDLTGRYGLSWNQESPDKAEAAALKGCVSDKCKIVFRTVPNQCAAIATNEGGKIWGGATRPKREAAERAALENCEKRTSDQCKLRGAQCNR